MGISKALFYGLAAIVGFIAVCLGKYNFVLRRWANVTALDKNDFQAANFNLHQESDIPTTYYEPGKLGEVLKEWHHNAFHLYRVKEGAKFEFDASQIRSPVVGKKLDYSCMSDPAVHECSKRSTLVNNCIFDYNNSATSEEMIEAGTILSGEGEGRGYRAAFANLTNKETIKLVWDSLNVPFSLASSRFEHSFISNLEYDAITAPFHANGLTDSMAYQLLGQKTWVFLPANTWVEMMQGTAAAAALFIKRAPPADTKPEAWVVTTVPGDVLFFPNCWGHSVYTYAGPNLLLNFRKIIPMNIIRQPVIWISTIMEYILTASYKLDVANTNQNVDAEVKKLSKFVPTKKENIRVNDLYAEMCTKEGGTGLDAQILGFMDAEVKRVKARSE